ncbi:RabGAP/TBC [Ceraceosorus guamensis]|uniref:RabGAP/TBC n=1 Tax=Ceraceosorus guamensis TaxID=1522189 RepID=A0A316W5Z3_9BASI|nr:RabGAP/TBC [Ceraceosorus guamensis]PWN44151.1 RabGAP/TBC [Ceraceosorus guamensis]
MSINHASTSGRSMSAEASSSDGSPRIARASLSERLGAVSSRDKKASTRAASNAARLKSFVELLDPSDLLPGHAVADSYSLRHLCLQPGGIPTSSTHRSSSSRRFGESASPQSAGLGWLRSCAWSVLLGLLPPEKSQWRSTLNQRRSEYYSFVSTLACPEASPGSGPSPHRDALLDQIYRDLSRSRRNVFAFYRAPVAASRGCPLAPLPSEELNKHTEPRARRKRATPRVENRHALLFRLAHINSDFADYLHEERDEGTPATSPLAAARSSDRHRQGSLTESASLHADGLAPDSTANRSPPIVLLPPSPETRRGHTPEADSSDAMLPSDVAQDFAKQDDQHSAGASPQQLTNGSARSLQDRRWHSLLRILFVYALLNPSTGYVQGMGEIAFVLAYVMGTSEAWPFSPSHHEDEEQNGEAEDVDEAYVDRDDDPPGAHAEADAFWLFSRLVGELRELYEFDGIDHHAASLHVRNGSGRALPSLPKQESQQGGMAKALERTSVRLRWLDDGLWAALAQQGLDPQLPYYSFRWLACLLSTELALPSVLQLWDLILAESGSATQDSHALGPKVEILIDMCCALLISLRGPLLGAAEPHEGDGDDSDAFSRCMSILQDLEHVDIGPVAELACVFRQRRLAAPLTGDGPPDCHQEATLPSTPASVRDRATQALRGWTGPGGPKWLSPATARSVSGGSTFSTPNRADETSVEASSTNSPRATFAKYAEAFQSSDAAASLSKASTNWTARAMASWGANGSQSRSRESSPLLPADGSPRPGSAAKLSLAGLFSRQRSDSSGTAASGPSDSTHPALRWSREMPNLPLPNVLDSPPERQEYGWASRPQLPASLASPNLNESPNTASTTGRFSPISTQSPGSVRGGSSVRGAGPKPLLLTGSARPPRESSGSHHDHIAEPSRKISSGPMAARNGSERGSVRGLPAGSRRDSSIASSIAGSSGWSSRPQSEFGDPPQSGHSSATPGTGNTPTLPSMAVATRLAEKLPPIGTTPGPALGLAGSANGKLTAAAFNRTRRGSTGDGSDRTSAYSAEGTAVGTDDLPPASSTGFIAEEHHASPAPIASSSETPLVAASSLTRPRGTGGAKARGSNGSVSSFGPSHVSSDSMEQFSRRESSRSSTSTTSPQRRSLALTESGASRPDSQGALSKASSDSSSRDSLAQRRGSAFSADRVTSGQTSESLPEEQSLEDPKLEQDRIGLQRFELTDEPIRLSELQREGSERSINRSNGIQRSTVRSKRAYSSVKKRQSEADDAEGGVNGESRKPTAGLRRSSAARSSKLQIAPAEGDTVIRAPSPGPSAGQTMDIDELVMELSGENDATLQGDEWSVRGDREASRAPGLQTGATRGIGIDMGESIGHDLATPRFDGLRRLAPDDMPQDEYEEDWETYDAAGAGFESAGAAQGDLMASIGNAMLAPAATSQAI